MEEVRTVTKVIKGEKYYDISCDGICFGLEIKYGYEPKIGDEIKLCTVRGSEIRGIFANGKKIFYKSDKQLEQERKEWLENNEKEKQEKFKNQKAELDKDYENLPEVFKKRIDKLRANNPRFRVDYESYEMFCCNEALKIAEALKTPEAIEEWSKLNYDKQYKMVKNLSDGHSGNTFGCAVSLAFWYLKESENVAKMHGALAPLVGSGEYGCVEKKAEFST